MNAIGIDGCRAGWFYVRLLESSRFELGLLEHIHQVTPWLSGHTVILVDMMIGLTDSPRGRKCDREARKVLSPLRHTSVFSAPCRRAVQQGSYQEGSMVNFRITGKKLSRQSWGISPRIREVDEFIRGLKLSQRMKIREIHPEVAFWSLNGKQPMAFNKKTAEGFEERMNLLRKYLTRADEMCDRALNDYRRSEVARDDIVDALVCACAASMHDRISSLPEVPEYDEYGVPMEIVYVE